MCCVALGIGVMLIGYSGQTISRFVTLLIVCLQFAIMRSYATELTHRAAAPSRETSFPDIRPRTHALRDDIQWLRDISVLAVLFYRRQVAAAGWLSRRGRVLRPVRIPDYAQHLPRHRARHLLLCRVHCPAFRRRLLPACYAMLAF